ncbi:glycosyltransferase family 2 protein [Acinetobacter brisouii]
MNLSIIIPVFNNSDLLVRLLYSIFDKNIECISLQIVVVDDGSQVPVENNLHEIKELALEKSIELIFIYQNNAGPASARNTGLKYAKGNYIWFCDADDIVVGECFINFLKKCPFDIIEFGYYDESIEKKITPKCNQKISTLDYLRQTDGRLYLWNKVFNRSILSGILFDERLLNLEDYIYNLHVFSGNYYVILLDEVFYEYKLNKHSITKSINLDKKVKMLNNTFIVQNKIIEIFSNKDDNYIFKRLLMISAAGLIFSLIKLKYDKKYFFKVFNFYFEKRIYYFNPFYFFNFKEIKIFLFLCLVNIFFMIFLINKKIVRDDFL